MITTFEPNKVEEKSLKCCIDTIGYNKKCSPSVGKVLTFEIELVGAHEMKRDEYKNRA